MPQAKYSIYAHLDAPVYEHLDRLSKTTNRTKGFIIAEGLKRMNESNIEPKHREPVKPQKRGWFDPVEFFTS